MSSVAAAAVEEDNDDVIVLRGSVEAGSGAVVFTGVDLAVGGAMSFLSFYFLGGIFNVFGPEERPQY